MNDVGEMRRGQRTSGPWKLGILLVFVGLVSFLTLAKNSYNLPKSNPVRHLAGASKMCAGRFASVPGPIAACRSAITFARPYASAGRHTLAAIEPQIPSASWLDHPSLRSPPTSL